MMGGEERAASERFARRVAGRHRIHAVGSGVDDGFAGVVRPFAGVLGVGVTVGGWAPPALAHLALGPLVARALADAGPDDGDDGDGVPTTPPENDDGQPELRVRDVIREESGRPSAGEDPATSADESDLDPPDGEDRSTTRATTETVTRLESGGESSGTAVTVDRTRRSVVRRQEGPELTVARYAPEVAVSRVTQGGPADGTAPWSDGTRTAPAGLSGDSDGTAREPASPTGSPRSTSSTGDRLLSAGQSGEVQGGAPGVRRGPSGPTTTTLTPGSESAARERVAGGTTADSAGSAPASEDGSVDPVAPARQVRQAGTGPESGASGGQRDGSGTGGPSMAVRHAAGEDAAGSDADAGAADGADEQGAPRPNGDGRGDSPDRIDDLVDVERLADRLERVFERKARIERERRGR